VRRIGIRDGSVLTSTASIVSSMIAPKPQGQTPGGARLAFSHSVGAGSGVSEQDDDAVLVALVEDVAASSTHCPEPQHVS
jgi:hypothetical protein